MQHYTSVLWRHNMGCVMCAKSNVEEWLPMFTIVCFACACKTHNGSYSHWTLHLWGSWGMCPTHHQFIYFLTIIFLDTVKWQEDFLNHYFEENIYNFSIFFSCSYEHAHSLMLIFFMCPPLPAPNPCHVSPLWDYSSLMQSFEIINHRFRET